MKQYGIDEETVHSLLQELEAKGYLKINPAESYLRLNKKKMEKFKIIVRILTMICRKGSCSVAFLETTYGVNKRELKSYLKKFRNRRLVLWEKGSDTYSSTDLLKPYLQSLYREEKLSEWFYEEESHEIIHLDPDSKTALEEIKEIIINEGKN